MHAIAFVQELDAYKVERLAPIVGAGQTSLLGGAPGDATKMLQVALANEISVSELAAAWMPNTPEVDVKIAFARQAGDEADQKDDVPRVQYIYCLTCSVPQCATSCH